MPPRVDAEGGGDRSPLNWVLLLGHSVDQDTICCHDVNTLAEIQMPLCGPKDRELMLRVVVTGPPLTGCTSLVRRLTRGLFTSTEDVPQQRQQTARIDIGCQVCMTTSVAKKSLRNTYCSKIAVTN